MMFKGGMAPGAPINARQILQQRAAQVPAAGGGQITTREIKKYVNAEPWAYYDTFLVAATAFVGGSATPNFAGVVFPIQFFNARTVGNAGYAITNVQDTNKLEADFECHRILVQPFGNPDILITGATTTMQSTLLSWMDCLVNGTTFELDFSNVVKFVCPTAMLPAGGGLYVPSISRSLAMAADNEIACPTNGIPDNRANQKLSEEIMFKQGSTFRAQLNGFGTPALAAASSVQTRINALTALAAPNVVGVRVVLEGVRGTPLLVGTPNH